MPLLSDFLRRTAGERPESVALIAGGAGERRVTFGQLDRESDALAAGLQASGVERGDRCAILMDNSPELVVSVMGVLKAGAVFTVLSPTLKDSKVAAILNDCGAKAVIASGAVARHVAFASQHVPTLKRVVWADAPPAGAVTGVSLKELEAASGRLRDPGTIDADLAAIIYTSGTTGESKGVMLTHRNLVNTTGVVTAYLKNTPDDVVCCILPMAFSYGLCQVLGCVQAGYSLLIEKSFAFPFDVLKRAAAARVTGLPGVPTMFARLIQMCPLKDIDLSSVRYATNAAAAIPPAHLRRFREEFPRVEFFPMYGQTECTRACFLDPSLVDSRPTSVGRAIANSELFIVDGNGNRLPTGETGELVVRGANVMRGYWGRPRETAEKLREWDIPGEKVLFTGDQFRMDAEGLFYYVGRQDDIFKCKGEKVAPREVEQAIYELHEVAEVAVYGVEDAVDGLAVKAMVVVREGATLTDMQVRRQCQARLEAFMVPKFVEFRAAIPKTDSGKIKRSALATSPAEGA